MSAIRTFAASVAAVLLTAGVGLATVAPADATRPDSERRTAVNPAPGDYNGIDHSGGAPVSFSFDGTQIHHFKVGNTTLGSVHVRGGWWDETCSGGYCFKGRWLLDDHVEGHWRRDGFGHPWHHFSAETTSFHPFVGIYVAEGLRPHTEFTYSDGHLRDFMWHQFRVSDVAVSSGDWKFHACFPRIHTCMYGSWETKHFVVGEFWRTDLEHPTRHLWTARPVCRPRSDFPCP